jgi:phosphatidylethanolamine/phosphatidyl-N-methylethanolamine N-methyltransferase
MNTKAVSRFYNTCAGVYDLLFDQVFREGRRLAFEALDLRAGQRVLEVGVGTGLTLPMYPRGVRVVGIDLSAPMLREADGRRSGLEPDRPVGLVRMDATHIASPDGAFDAVFAPYVVSVVPEPRRVVAEMARVCRPGGRVVVLNHFACRHPVPHWFERRLSPLTHRVGFRLDLPIETILDIPTLHVESEARVNMLGMWRLVVFQRREGLPRLAPEELRATRFAEASR